MSSFLKKFLVIATALASLTFAFPALAASYGLSETQQATGGLLPTGIAGKQTIPEVVGAIVSAGLGLIGVVFFLLILYAGFSWMIAMGNTEKVSKAKEMLEAAIIGLVIVLASYAIATFVFTSLGGGSESVSPSGGIVQGQCNSTLQKSGDVCDLNSTCATLGGTQLKCVSDCEFVEFGTCGTRASCADPTKIIENKCPGGTDNVCCKP